MQGYCTVGLIRGGALLMNMHTLSSINRKVSRWVVGVLLSALCAKGGGGYFHIYSLYDIDIIFSYNFVLILSGLKYSAGLVPFIMHPVINIFIYINVYTFCRIFHFRNFAQPPSSRPSFCTSHKLSPRELNFCVPCVIIVHDNY